MDKPSSYFNCCWVNNNISRLIKLLLLFTYAFKIEKELNNLQHRMRLNNLQSGKYSYSALDWLAIRITIYVSLTLIDDTYCKEEWTSINTNNRPWWLGIFRERSECLTYYYYYHQPTAIYKFPNGFTWNNNKLFVCHLDKNKTRPFDAGHELQNTKLYKLYYI